jgi:outer membrane biosynthesis protein TonB
MKPHLVLTFCLVFSLSRAVEAASVATTPVRIEQTVEARFPVALAYTTITSGEARVLINIDADGQLADLLVTGYTEKAFADEAVTLLHSWRYSAATVNGQPVGVRLELNVQFVSTGRVVTLTPLDTPEALMRSHYPAALVSLVSPPVELDRPIQVVHSVVPPTPASAETSAPHAGSALVDFYVDESGRARMPVVVEMTSAGHAQAAVDALNEWRFATPLRRGQPCAVRVQQRFVFRDVN